MSFGQRLSTLSSYSVSMNYPPASQRHTAVQGRETSREVKDGVSLKEREEEVMAHFTQCTEEITGGLQTWHGDVSANNQMQICHLQRNWGPGRDAELKQGDTDGEMFHSARSKGYLAVILQKLLPCEAAESTHLHSMRTSDSLLLLVPHVGLLKCHVLLHISHTLTTVQDTRPGLSAMMPESHLSFRAIAQPFLFRYLFTVAHWLQYAVWLIHSDGTMYSSTLEIADPNGKYTLSVDLNNHEHSCIIKSVAVNSNYSPKTFPYD